MIEEFSSALEKRKKIESFKDFENITWVVSDLKSKSEMEKYILNQKGFLESDSCLRAQEFWKLIFLRAFPERRLISESFMKILSKEITGSMTSFLFLKKFLPLFSHPEGKDVFGDWMSGKKHLENNLRYWLDKGYELWDFLKQKQVATPSLAPALLMNEGDLSSFHWPKRIYFDLGSSLTIVEADLINLLRKSSFDVKVLRPSPPWQGAYHQALFSYSYLENIPTFEPPVAQSFPLEDSVEIQKHSHSLDEVKSAVTTIKKWYKEGVPFSKMALLAPQMKEYWSVLEVMLREDGIPVQKKVSKKLHSLPSVHRWLSRLRVSLGVSYESSHLESALFSESYQYMNYKDFKINYSHVYGKSDLERSKSGMKGFTFVENPKKTLSFKDFMAWALKLERLDFEVLQQILNGFYENFAENFNLSYEAWFSYLEALCAELEQTDEEACLEGVCCENIFSAENLRATHVFILGVTQTFLGSGNDSFELSLVDLKSLYDDKGFALDWPEFSKTEFELAWLLSLDLKKVVLSAPQFHFSGERLNPSRFWLKPAVERGVDSFYQFKDISFFSQFKNKKRDSIVEKRKPPAGKNLIKGFSCDEGLEDFDQIPYLKRKFSASSLKLYNECPFKWSAKHLFCLDDRPNKDIDTAALEKGHLIHKILELVTLEEDFPSVSDPRVKELIEETFKEKGVSGDFQESLKSQFLSTTKGFLEREKEELKEHPEHKILKRELKVEAAWSFQHKIFIPINEKEERDFSLKIFIDRVDQLENSKVRVLDYKSGNSTSYTNAKSWAKNKDFQLWIYAKALEQGVSELGSCDVKEAFYYTLRDVSVKKGMDVDKMKIKKDELDTTMSALITESLEEMEQGHIPPKPQKVETCNSCLWRKLCRAPHLNF